MKEITAAKAAEYAESPLFCGPADHTAHMVERDSRKADAGSIFVGLPGEKNDGNDFAQSAYENGCRIFLLSSEAVARQMKENHPDASVILADDSLAAMQRMAKNYIADQDIIRIAVTGSVGKTSTKEMLYRIFSSKYRTICNYENYNNHIGVPLTAFTVEEDTEVGIFEMGMNHSGEIHLLADLIRPHTAAITNVGTSHIGNLGSRDAILAAKLEIADFMDETSTLVYNADNDKLSILSERETDYKKIPVSFTEENGPPEFGPGIVISELHTESDSISFRLTCGEESCRFDVPLPGAHNACNAALAAACGLVYGISLEESSEALSSMVSNSVRLNAISGDGIIVIDDTYNASPDSVRAAIDVLRGREASRRVAVLADMFELGDNSDEYHRSIGEYTASNGVDVLVAVGKNAVHIAEGAAKMMDSQRIFHVNDAREFMERAHEIIRKNDTVLVKGSHGMSMHQAAEYLVNTGEWNGR